MAALYTHYECAREGTRGDRAVASGSQGNDDSKQTKQSESKVQINNEDEENIIEENLEHLNKFLSDLYERGLDNIPVKSLGKITLRKKWRKILYLLKIVKIPGVVN